MDTNKDHQRTRRDHYQACNSLWCYSDHSRSSRTSTAAVSQYAVECLPERNEYRNPNSIKIHGEEDKVQKGAPLLGEDNELVYSSLLGMTKQEIDELYVKEII